MAKKCTHPYVVPIEYAFGKMKRVPGTRKDILDFGAVMQNAHKMRVTKLYCPKCQITIKVKEDDSNANKNTKTSTNTKDI